MVYFGRKSFRDARPGLSSRDKIHLSIPFMLLIGALVAIVVLNHRVYRFFYRQRGWVFVLGVIPLHVLYYSYSAIAFVAGGLAHLAARATGGHRSS